jgi:hypothetical protein
MTLTYAERLILLNQYRILAKLEPDVAEHRHAMEELESGLHETEEHACPKLPEPLSAEESDFAWEVMSFYEDRDLPFYGFQSARLNSCVRYWCGTISKDGKPLTNEEYRAMLSSDAVTSTTSGEQVSLSQHL